MAGLHTVSNYDFLNPTTNICVIMSIFCSLYWLLSSVGILSDLLCLIYLKNVNYCPHFVCNMRYTVYEFISNYWIINNH